MHKKLFLILFPLFLIGCKSTYVHGYNAAWNHQEPSCWASQEERDGYEQGLDDAWMYDEGYYDASLVKKPKYHDDPDYMDGYRDGKRFN